MKLTPVSNSSGTYIAEKEAILSDSFPSEPGEYSKIVSHYMAAWDSQQNRLCKVNTPFKWKKVLFWNNSSSDYTYNQFVQEKNVFITGHFNPSILTKIDLDTLQRSEVNDTPLSFEPELVIWDSPNQRFICLSDSNFTSGSPFYAVTKIATVDWDGTIVERGDFTVFHLGNNSSQVARKSADLVDGKLYVAYGSDSYNREPYKHGLSVIDTTTWVETKIVETSKRPNINRAGPPGSHRVLTCNGGSDFGFVDTLTDTPYIVSTYGSDINKFPVFTDLGFNSDYNDKFAQTSLYWHRDKNGNVLYKVLVEGSQKCGTTALRNKHWVIDIDLEKFKTDPYNSLSNPQENRYNNENTPYSGKISLITNDENVKDLTAFTFGAGERGSSTQFFGISFDGGLSVYHPMGASESSDDYKNFVNTFGVWQEAIFKDGEIWFCGHQGIGKITPIVDDDNDCLFTSVDGKPCSLYRPNFKGFWFN